MAENSSRQYPEISFVDTDTERLMNSLIQSYEIITGRKLYPADPARIFILWIADIITQERVMINEAARQNVPRYAEGENLDSLAEIFKDTERLPPKAATTTLRFYLSETQESAQTIPKGTRVTVDGSITFETTEAVTIPAGSAYGDANAVCQEAGEIGNGFIPEQITQLVDPYPFYKRVGNTTTSEGGTDIETDAHFYERLRDSMETFSTAGPAGAYIYWAKTASTKIADVRVASPESGKVDVRVLLSGGELPGPEILNSVTKILSSDTVRPLTDYVTVAAPETIKYNIDVTFYISADGAVSEETIAANVVAAVQSFREWQSAKMGRDVNPSYLIQLLMQAGAKRVVVRSPDFIAVPENSVAQNGETAIVNGGVEDE